MSIRKDFKNITGFELFPREVNHVLHGAERKDGLFEKLTYLSFSHVDKFKALANKVEGWLATDQSDTMFALAGYVYYIEENYEKARDYFLEAIYLVPQNLDSWIDLAFTFRQLGEYSVSRSILFNYRYMIYYYNYLKLGPCGYRKIKDLALEINTKLLLYP